MGAVILKFKNVKRENEREINISWGNRECFVTQMDRRKFLLSYEVCFLQLRGRGEETEGGGERRINLKQKRFGKSPQLSDSASSIVTVTFRLKRKETR